MERILSSSVVDQVRIRGQYEHLPTDTHRLAAELSAPQDVSRLLTDFDNGHTPLRDVSGMLTAQRTAIFDAYQYSTISNLASLLPEILSVPVHNLHNRVVSGEQDQPIGHNFFVNATGFIEARRPWAMQFDELLRHREGRSIHDIAISGDLLDKDRLLAEITQNPNAESITSLAVYLAGRSFEGERYLGQNFGHSLIHARNRAKEITQTIGTQTGLRSNMLDRATGQFQRVAFGSFDHLVGLVTSDNSGAAGDYSIGSLRVEIHFDGSVRSARLRNSTDAHQVLAHEVQHAGSAQAHDVHRCGLQINGHGLEANEGMTEYLAQLSAGSPGIEQLANGSLHIQEQVPYRVPVIAMVALHEQFKSGKNRHFATLFNAYHGDVSSQESLEKALDAFYQYDRLIADRLT